VKLCEFFHKPTLAHQPIGVLRVFSEQLGDGGAQVAVFDALTAAGVTEDQMRQMFEANRLKLIAMSQIDQALAQVPP
jgi:hypothetical protein